jgi:quercetin dioxygenase-like cupin family protein
MAKIILEPNESFEHYHTSLSSTTLLTGTATYEIDGLERNLEIGKKVMTPGQKSHVIRNKGFTECVIDCGAHGGTKDT